MTKENALSKYISEQPTSFQNRIKKLEELRESGHLGYPYHYNVDSTSEQINDLYSAIIPGERTETEVSLAGRIMSMRVMGNISFLDLQDNLGKIQLFFSKKTIGNEQYKLIKKVLDRGDIIGVKGKVFKTKRGELSVDVNDYEILAKSLRDLPDSHFGLKVENRYRQRYLDLLINSDAKKVVINRSKIFDATRELLKNKGYLEVDTPILQPIYGGANARPFKTYYNAIQSEVYLRIADELYLKRCVIGGIDRVFEFAKDFRNEDIDTTHNPEFTQLEMYAAYLDYNDMMNLAEDIVSNAARTIHGTAKITYQGQELDLTPPWRRISMKNAVKDIGGVNIDNFTDDELKTQIKDLGIEEIVGGFTRGKAMNILFEELVEGKLIQPTFIIDYPLEISPLTKKHRSEDGLVERFEFFIAGREFGNAYSELNDPLDQRCRFIEQQKSRELGDDEAHPIDEDFLLAMEYGMPPMGGLGIGMERLVALITDNLSIKEVILFPAMRPKKKDGDDKGY